MPIVMQIPLQQKIAELEQRLESAEKRLAVLEGQRMTRTVTEERTFVSVNGGAPSELSSNGVFGHHWREMWKHFEQMMQSVFPQKGA